MSKSFENANQELVLSKETSLEDLDDDAPIYLELNARETHTYNWVKKEGKRVLQEYFDCEPFELAEDEGDTLFLSNLPYIEGNLPTEEPPRALNSSKV
uniref:Peptidase_S9_N domain-containing protein n=1 Tax=Caenorhabditis tropicalis TaxID=1561998 RepID=A0A1I7UH86_9PELO